MKRQIDLEKAGAAEVFGALAARRNTRRFARKQTKPYPTAAQLRVLNEALCTILEFARESGAERRCIKAGNVSFKLQEQGAEEILSVRKLVGA